MSKLSNLGSDRVHLWTGRNRKGCDKIIYLSFMKLQLKRQIAINFKSKKYIFKSFTFEGCVILLSYIYKLKNSLLFLVQLFNLV